MTTEPPDETERINEELQEAWDRQRDIGDGLARRIARRLSDDGPLNLFAETGAITRGLAVQLAAIGEDPREPHGIWAAALLQYCERHGVRGPRADWKQDPRP